jgi:hypothetical protein
MRVQVKSACYFDPPGPGRLRAGQWVCDNAAELLPGDIFWPGGNLSKLPTNTPGAPTGADSVSG